MMVIIWHNDNMTNRSRWSLSYFSIRRDVMSVLSSNHFSSQHLKNDLTNCLLLFPNMPMLNSRTFEFKTLGMDDYLWVQALFNHEELERLRGVKPTNPHQRFLWRIIRMGVIDPETGEKVMDASTRSMRRSSAIGMRLWKMWREAESQVSP